MSATACLLTIATLMPAAAAEPIARTDDSAEALATLLATMREELDLPGVAVALVHEGRPLLVRGFGVASVEDGRPMDGTSVVRFGPIAETMISVLAASMMDAGRAAFDTSLIRGLPQVRLRTRDLTRSTTLGALLGHRAGIRLDEALWSCAPDASDVVGAIADAAIDTDGRVHLTAMSPFVAAMLLGELAGRDAESLLRARLLDPLDIGARVNDCEALDADGSRRAVGHRRIAASSFAAVELPSEHGAALRPVRGLWASVDSFVPYLTLIAEGGRVGDRRIVSRERLLQTWDSTDAVGLSALADRRISMGWLVEPAARQTRISRSGVEAGQSSTIMAIPEHRMAVAVFAPVDDSNAVEAIAASILARLIESTQGGAADGVDAEAMRSLDGRYLEEPGGASVRVRTAAGRTTVELLHEDLVALLPPDAHGRRAGVSGDMAILAPARTPGSGVFVGAAKGAPTEVAAEVAAEVPGAAPGAAAGAGPDAADTQDRPDERFAVLLRHSLPTVLGPYDLSVEAIGGAAATLGAGELLNIYSDEACTQRILVGLGSGGGPMMLVSGEIPLTLYPNPRAERDGWLIQSAQLAQLDVERAVDGTVSAVRLSSATASVRLEPQLPLADPDPRRAGAALLGAIPRTAVVFEPLRLRGTLHVPTQGLRVAVELVHLSDGLRLQAALPTWGAVVMTADLRPSARPRTAAVPDSDALSTLIYRTLLDVLPIIARGAIVEPHAAGLFLGPSERFETISSRVLTHLKGDGDTADLRIVLHISVETGELLGMEIPDAGPLLIRRTRVETMDGVPTVLEATIMHPRLGTMTLTLEPPEERE